MEPKMAQASARVRVGSFELDLRSGELRAVGADVAAERVILREQPFQVLRMLVEREGKIVTRSEIKKRLWPNDTIVDFDHSINVAIGVLRRALGDSAANPRYIETLARRGYRLLASVEWLESRSPASDEADSNDTPPIGVLIGKRVGQYRVLEVLGGGGMGMVYKAEDLKLGRRVALKFLPVDLAGDSIALQRLEREAQTASALNHPNICTIYDIEEYDGHSFIAMELLEGDTLQERLAALAPSPVPLLTLIDIAIQICAGLEAAHSQTIVHRDIKPGNIFLTRRAAKLLDFGVAKLVAGEEPARTGTLENRSGELRSRQRVGLTLTGAAVGTAGYMSPEQVRREELDGRSDLFSLGLVLYEMATGQRAFTGETALAVQEEILTTTPLPVETVNTAVPRALALVVAKALEKDRGQRYQTATDMRQALERARADLVQSSARRTRRWLPAVAVIVVIASVSVWLSSRRVSRVTLAASDTIVLAHVANSTSNRVYDEALYTALRVSLEQTPYLNVLADNKVRGTLSDIGLAENDAVTGEIALRICRRTGSRIAVAPAIADAGNRLRLELKTMDCQSGSTISLIRQEAASRNDVVAALGSAALQLRRELGEPTASLASYNVPLDVAASPSPDALELLTLGYRRQLAGSSQDAIPYYERAVQIDPNLALAHAALGSAYTNAGYAKEAAAAARTAFSLRDRMTAPARFHAESAYHREVNGDSDASCAVLAQWVDAFPHDVIARINLSSCLLNVGEPDRSLGEAREAARLLPAGFTYAMWIGRAIHTDRLDEAQKALDEARARGFDSPLLRDWQVQLAFLGNDEAAMQQQWTWAGGHAEAHQLIGGKALVETSRGQFRAALRTQQIATSLAASIHFRADYGLEMALARAMVGLPPERTTVTTNNLFGARLLGALVSATTGPIDDASRAADVLRREFPLNTTVQKYGLPLIDATVRLRLNDAAGAVVALEPTTKHDLSYNYGIFPALYSSYVRGTAYLGLNKFDAAIAEFQRVLTHPGLTSRWVFGPLARLQTARAQRAKGDDTAARSSYEAFLALWKDADADIPVYREAKAEYSALRDGRTSSTTR
jgi:eukaryotic-like serine/threonine-protein kinase